VIFRRARAASGTHSRGKEAPPVAPDPCGGPDAPLAAHGLHSPRRDQRAARPRTWVARTLLIAALVLAAQAAWMPAKAALAQHLLASSWQQSRQDGSAHRPWPWADTHPVARLEQPRLGISQVVLAGDSGRPLAFGPGWAESSAKPGSDAGTVVISGHRDTHFSWLRELRDGDTLRLEHAGGERDYRVVGTEVVDSRTHRLATGDNDSLVLVTCWPFDAASARGPMRYLVTLAPAAPAAERTRFRPAAPAKR
jgi:sortase A